MKKKIITTMMCCIILVKLAAQGQIVVDIAEARETINMTEQTYQQVQNTIKQLQYEYEQTKKQIQNSAGNNSGEANIKESLDYINKNITFVHDIEKRLKTMRINIGNGSYDLSSVYKVPGGMFTEIADFRIQKMSDKEKARISTRYGFNTMDNTGNEIWENKMFKELEKITVLADEAEKQYKQNYKDIAKITNKSHPENKIITALQANNELHRELYEQLGMLSFLTTGNIVTFAEAKIVESYSKPTTTVSDDFFKKSPMPDLNFGGEPMWK